MESEILGKTISFLRKRAGYTQRELSELLDISDKAVSKWERGLSCPDISLLAKLSIILDTDIESLLQGNVFHCNHMWKGVMIFDNSEKISAATQIYDKPMVYYLLSYFMLVGIKDILIVCSFQDQKCLQDILCTSEKIGINLIYYVQNQTDDWEQIWKDNISFLSGYNVMVVYGKKFLYGIDITKTFQRAMARRKSLTLITTQDRYDGNSKKLMLDMNKRILLENNNFQENFQQSYYTIPIFFCTSELTEKIRLNKVHFSLFSRIIEKYLYAEVIGRGIVQFNLQNWDDIIDVSTFVKAIQKNQNEYIACIEEIAWRRGFITKKELKALGEEKAGTEYGDYILRICKEG